MSERKTYASSKAIDEPTSLWPVDRLLLGTLGALSTVAAVTYPHPLKFVLVFGALALFIYTTARLGPHSRLGDLLHAFAPLFVIVAIFETVGFLVGAANPTRWDSTFSALDLRLFGPLVPAWHNAFGRPAWLTDVLSVAYMAYYVVPTVMGVALYLRERREEFDKFVFALQATCVASYACYFLFPTAGPRIPLAEAQQTLGGGAASRFVRLFLDTCELNAFDAFPSGHTAIAVVFLVYGWKFLPRFRLPLAATVFGIIFSTVYLSHHYIVDLFAGAALALGMLFAMPHLERAFGFSAALWVRREEELPS
jgi:membrane-associated phospholipid phosphatase